ncbi:MAG: zinc-ribbon domain-containing protein [Betaproteobacteria bacterium]|nr:zinc-ribbon domain-containing protein [Betaproteobacteria bacterium]
MLITRCPRCATAFRVSKEQIAAREGNVRCGRCGALFDAHATLRKQADNPQRAADALPQPDRPVLEETPAPVPEADQSAPVAAPPAEVPAEDPAPGANPARMPWAARANEEPESDFDQSIAPERTRRTGRLALALLVVLLLAQLAFHYRGEIALLAPESKPHIKALCEMLGCELPLPRRAELMSIESSDLRADTANPEVMVLSASLRNRAAFPQALPALELTLTDLQDRPLARRVLLAQQYLGKAARIEEGFAANSELQLKVFIDAASLGAAGYRLYLFFP